MSRSSRPVRPPGQFIDGLSRVPTIEHMTIQRMDHGEDVPVAVELGGGLRVNSLR